MSKWTDVEIEVLKANYATKSSAIMKELLPGRSRFAIIGKADRLGLPGISDEERVRRIREGIEKGDQATRAHLGGTYDPWRGA
jgi:hypothetical protein